MRSSLIKGYCLFFFFIFKYLVAILCSLMRTNCAKSDEFALNRVYTFTMWYFFCAIAIFGYFAQYSTDFKFYLKKVGTKIKLQT